VLGTRYELTSYECYEPAVELFDERCFDISQVCPVTFVAVLLLTINGHAGSAIKVLVAIHYSVLDARNGYIRNVVV